MKRIVINVDRISSAFKLGTAETAERFVVRTDKICGLIEEVDGTVKLSLRTKEDAPIRHVYILTSFDEVAEAMLA